LALAGRGNAAIDSVAYVGHRRPAELRWSRHSPTHHDQLTLAIASCGRLAPAPAYFAFEFSRSAGCDELSLLSTKPFWTPDATVLKPAPDINCAKHAPERRI
jgi:hypothetical protein